MLVHVKVVPRAKKERIDDSDGRLKVYVCDPAQDGRANKKVIKLLAEYYQAKKYNITIVRGQKQRDKIIEITNNED